MFIDATKVLVDRALISQYFAELLTEQTSSSDSILIKSESGEIIKSCSRPSVLYYHYSDSPDHKDSRIYKIDDYTVLLPFILKTKEILASFNNDIADSVSENLRLIELPRNQSLLDNIVSMKGFLDKFIRRCESLNDGVMDILNHPV